MSVLTKEELISKLRKLGGTEPSDEIIELLEDVEDSWLAEDTEYTKEKFEALESKWRKRYADRFEKGCDPKEVKDEKEEVEEVEEKTKFEDLFKEVK